MRTSPWLPRHLGQLVDVLDHMRVPVSAKERAYRSGDVPYYGAAGQVGWIDKPLFNEPLLLLGEDGVQFFGSAKSKAYLIDGPAWVNNHAHVLRVRDSLAERRFLMYYLNWTDYHGFANGTTRLKLTKSAMMRIPIRLPPLDEQQRIVAILEDHLSRLDAAEAGITNAERRLKCLHKSVLMKLIPDAADYPADWETSTVGQAGKVDLGRQRHPDWHTGANVRPYLRVANVFEDRIDTRSLYEMHWPGDTFDRFRLLPGDVLLNEGQTSELLGRPALYRGQPPEVAFTNSLLRFQASEAVLPEFALLVFRRHMHGGRFTRESRITTNIAHLSAARLKPIEFPIPPLSVQKQLVNSAEQQLSALTHIGAETAGARSRSAGLRRALLGAAFSGRLA